MYKEHDASRIYLSARHIMMAAAAITAVLALCMLVTADSDSSYAHEYGEWEGIGYDYNPNDGSMSVYTRNGDAPIPDAASPSDCPWYKYVDNLKSVNIGPGVTGIGDYAFSEKYTHLTVVAIMGNPTYIGSHALAAPNISYLGPNGTLPGSLQTLGPYSVTGLPLTTFAVGSNLSSVDPTAFGDTVASFTGSNSHLKTVDGVLYSADGTKLICYPAASTATSLTLPTEVQELCCTIKSQSLTSIAINAALASLGSHPFDCPNLSTFTENNNPNFSVIFQKQLLSADNRTLYFYGKSTSCLPYDSVVAIADYACSNHTFTSLVLKNKVEYIGAHAFEGCTALASVDFGDGVTEVGERAFYGCRALTSVDLGTHVSLVGTDAFRYMGLTSVTAGGAAGSVISSYAFAENSGLVSVDLSGDFTIWDGAFRRVGDNLAGMTVTLGDGAMTLQENAFSDSMATKVTIGKDAVRIFHNAFNGCSVEDLTYNAVNCTTSFSEQCLFPFSTTVNTLKVTFGDEVQTIPAYLLYSTDGRSNFSNVKLPESVQTIGMYAFYNCDSLSFIAFPSSVEIIEDHAFEDCGSLSQIMWGDGITTICPYAFKGTALTGTVSLGSHVSSIGESAFLGTDITSLSLRGADSTSVVGTNAFRGNVNMTSLSISNINVGDGAFYNCGSSGEGMATTITNGLYSVGVSAFENSAISTEIDLKTVTSIGGYAFKGCSKLTSFKATGAESATIGAFSLQNCSALTYVKLDGGFQTIDQHAFSGAGDPDSGMRVTLSTSVITIAEGAFEDSNLKNIDMSPATQSIGGGAFRNCTMLTSVLIPSSTQYLSSGTFAGCTALKTVYFYSPSCSFDADDRPFSGAGSVNGMTVTFGDAVVDIGAGLFRGSNLSGATMPSGVQTIGDYAFAGTRLTTISVPDTVSGLGEGAFSSCTSLQGAKLPSGVTTIDDRMFDGCTSLESVTMPSAPVAVGDRAFAGTRISTLTIPASVRTVGTEAFTGTMLTEVTMPDTVETWGTGVFGGCTSLRSVSLPDGMTAIPSGTFDGCTKLTSITIPDSVQTIGNGAFYGCSALSRVITGTGMTSIGISSFGGCSISYFVLRAPSCADLSSAGDMGWDTVNGVHVDISSGVTRIPAYLFSGASIYWLDLNAANCADLSENAVPGWDTAKGVDVTIGQSVTAIPDHLLKDCKIKRLYFSAVQCAQVASGNDIGWDTEGGTEVTIGADVSIIPDFLFENARISSMDFKAVQCEDIGYPFVIGWLDGQDISVSIADGVRRIPANLFRGSGNIGSVTIPSSVVYIGEYAFHSAGLTSLVLPDTVTDIGDCAFLDCGALKTLTYNLDPSCNVGGSVFNRSGDSMKVSFGPAATTIHEGVFIGADLDQDLVIPDTVDSIGAQAFRGTGLATLEIPDSVYIGAGAFMDCTSLTTITAGTGGNIDSESIFSGCTHVTSVTIVGDGFIIPTNMFLNLGSEGAGATVVLPEGLEDISNEAFKDAKLNSITIPSTVTNVRNAAFDGTTFYDIGGTQVLDHTPDSLAGYKFVLSDGKLTKCDTGFTFVTNGGSAIADRIGIEGRAVSVDDPTRDHYDFAGWYGDQELTEPYAVTVYPATHVTVYAKWTLYEYSITYSNVTAQEHSNPATYTIETDTFSLQKASRNGYVFEGWYGNKDFEGDAVTQIALGSFGDRALYAKWSIPSYAIVYNMNGGTNSPSNPASFTVEDAIEFVDPTRADYDFEGWYTDSNFAPQSKVEGITLGTYEPVTVYAKWTAHGYAIAYENVTAQEHSNPATYTIETATFQLTDASRNGYDFGGWFSDEGCTEQNRVTQIVQGSTGDRVLYAKLTPVEYALTYVLDGGTNGNNPDAYTIESEFDLADATKTGFAFGGWYTDLSDEDSKVTRIAIGTTGARTFYAKFTICNYAVKYVLDGNELTGDYAAADHEYGSEVSVLADYTKTGYTVTPWSTDDVDVAGGKFAMPAKDVTFSATSSVNSYTVTYTFDGKVYDASSEEYGSEVTLVDSPVRKGFTVSEWSAEGIAVTDGRFTMPARDVTFACASTPDEGTEVTVNEDGTTTVVITTEDQGTTSVETMTTDADGNTIYYGVTDTTTVDGMTETVTQSSAFDNGNATLLYDYTLVTEEGTTKVVATLYLPAGSVEDNSGMDLTSVPVDVATLGDAVRYRMGPGPVYDLTLMKADEAVTQFSENVTVGVYYELADGEDADTLVVVYIDAEGNMTQIACSYDVSAKMVSFPTDHFSMYGIAHSSYPVTLEAGDNTAFADVTGLTGGMVDHDGSFTFKVSTTAGYDRNLVVKNGDTVLTAVDGVYTVSNVTSAVTITAGTSVNTYTVTFAAGENGSVSATTVEDVPYGATFAVDGSSVTISGTTVTATADAATAQYTYAFGAWSPEFAAVTGDVTYTASFTATVNTYTVTWKNGDTVLETDTGVAYGTVPTYDGPTPTQAATAEYTYTFSSWGPAVGKVTGDTVYSAVFDYTVNSYTVSYSLDGEVLTEAPYSAQEYTYGSQVTVLAVYQKTGYDVSAWSSTVAITEGKITVPASDIVLSATSSAHVYTVTLLCDNGSAGSATIAYGTSSFATFTGAERTGHSVTGYQTDAGVRVMDASGVLVAGIEGYTDAEKNWTCASDVSLKAVVQPDVHTLTVAYVYTDGRTAADTYEDDYEYGRSYLVQSPAITGHAPDKSTVAGTMGTVDVNVLVTYSVNEYTITFDSDGGSAVAAITQDYGTALTEPADPTKEGHTFSGWMRDGAAYEFPDTMPAESFTLTASWNVNNYTITFDSDGGSSVGAITQDYGTALSAPAVPTKIGYAFAGWLKDAVAYEFPDTMPAESFTLTASWNVNSYTISFESNGGSSVTAITQDYGTAVSVPADPTRDGYTFKEWQLNGVAYVFTTMPAENITLYAVWAVNPVSPSAEVVEFDSNSETVTIDLTVGEVADALADPAKTEVEIKGSGWTMEFPKDVIAGASGTVSAGAKILSDSDIASLSEDVQKLVQGKTVYNLSLTDDNGTVTFTGKTVTVTLPYTLKDGEDASDVKVYYIDSNNEAVEVDATYENGYVKFSTDHFSTWYIDATESESGSGGGSNAGLIVGIIVAVVVVAAVVVVVVLIKTGKIDLSGGKKDDGASEGPDDEPVIEAPAEASEAGSEESEETSESPEQ